MREGERLYMDPTLEQTLLQMREEGEEQEVDEEEQAREDQQAKLFWDGVKLCGIMAVGCGIYGLARHGKRRLPVVLLLEGTLFLLASICATYQWAIGHGAAPRPKFPDGALSILSWSAALSSLCCVRLLWSKQYGGESLDLNFGPRVHECDDGVKFIRNVAFDWFPDADHPASGSEVELQDCDRPRTIAEVRRNIIGHCAWGLVAWLLFPASERLLYRCNLAMLGRFASLWLVAYPLYNWLKRTFGSVSPAKYFSVTSFCKTGIEWAVGFFVAVALGFLCTALEGGAAARLGRGRRHSGPDRRHYRNGEGVSWLVWWCRLETARQLLGIFLAACVFSTAVQICYTWTTVPEGYPEKGKPLAHPPERGFTIGAQLLLAPTLLFSLVWVFGRER